MGNDKGRGTGASYGGFNGKGRENGGSVRSVARMKYEQKRLGKMGAASGVRNIDPSSIDVSKYLKK